MFCYCVTVVFLTSVHYTLFAYISAQKQQSLNITCILKLYSLLSPVDALYAVVALSANNIQVGH